MYVCVDGWKYYFICQKEGRACYIIYRESNFVLLLLFNVVVAAVAATTVAGTDADDRKDF